MAWSIHTTEPTAVENARAALTKARDLRLRSDERSRILANQETDDEAVARTKEHMSRAIDAAVALAGNSIGLIHVSLSGDLAVEGVAERTSISVDLQANQAGK